MEPKLKEAILKDGIIVKENNFETYRGVYQISIIKYKGQFYFRKTRNGNLVEFSLLK